MSTHVARWTARMLAGAVLCLGLAGCPPYFYLDDPLDGTEGESGNPDVIIDDQDNTDYEALEYEAGFDDGFMEDEYYWDGFWDSMETVDAGPILYSGSDIPAYEEISYTAGYYDGLWTAYNDGYFVAYDYAFTIGFSEGYDLFFREEGFDLLAADEHMEYLDGGFSDGYNDGYSEGRMFGVSDYLAGYEFDWILALYDYRGGTDIYIEEYDLGTGEYGPVYLYEYGTDPNEYIEKGPVRAPRFPAKSASMRTLTAEAREALSIRPAQSTRSELSLTLQDTWLERIEAYEARFSTR